MSIYLKPVNLKQWDMFSNVKATGYVEPFLATKAMMIGDLVLLHVGQQDKRYESGVYAYDRVVEGPFILRDHPDDYYNGKNTVMVKFERIMYNKPIVDHEHCHEFSGQFRTVHLIDPAFYIQIMAML